MGLWRTGRGFVERGLVEKPKFKSGGVVPDARLAKSAATGRATVEEVVVPESFSPYTQQLVSKKTVLAQLGIEPNFDGVGDTMDFGPATEIKNMPGGGSDGYFGPASCAWCGSYPHKPDCTALARNYPRTSLSTQRAMTEALRAEIDRKVERTYYQGSWESKKSATPVRPAKPEPPKDVRTDMQKRFDAIAEELEENK